MNISNPYDGVRAPVREASAYRCPGVNVKIAGRRCAAWSPTAKPAELWLQGPNVFSWDIGSGEASPRARHSRMVGSKPATLDAAPPTATIHSRAVRAISLSPAASTFIRAKSRSS